MAPATVGEYRSSADKCQPHASVLETAPAYLSDTAAADVLALLGRRIGETLDNGLAARRYGISGDRRALSGIPCHRTWTVCH